MSAKFITSLVAAGAMIATLSVATPASALDQRQRNIVGGVVLGVIGTLAVQNYQQSKRTSTTTYSTRNRVVCRDPYRTYRNGKLVTVCR
jgi:uncharacterized membrane protein YebE (DUF533 family)